MARSDPLFAPVHSDSVSRDTGTGATGALEALTGRLGHDFARPVLLREAITHPSAARGGGYGYERLEFLGDRVLGLIVADMLMRSYPDEDEGALSRRLVALVRSETLAEIARSINLGAALILARGEDESGGRRNPGILADACEAVIAALYLDGGLAAARRFVESHWSVPMIARAHPPQDAKTALQEWAQARGRPLPRYHVIDSTGPAHNPRFTVEVSVDGLAPASGSGTSKRGAEQAAAAALLDAAGVAHD